MCYSERIYKTKGNQTKGGKKIKRKRPERIRNKKKIKRVRRKTTGSDGKMDRTSPQK